jgi:hypothetical protein
MRLVGGRVSPRIILPILITISIGSILAHQSQRISASAKIRGLQIPVPDARQMPNRSRFSSKGDSLSITFVLAPYRKSSSDLDVFLNASVSSWIQKGMEPKFLVFENQKPAMAELEPIIRRHFGTKLFLGPRLEMDEMGLGYVDDYIQKSIDLCQTDFICFIVEDTILPADFGAKVKRLHEFYTKKSTQFALVGNRCQIYAPLTGVSVEDLARDFAERASLAEVDARDNSGFSHDFLLISMNKQMIDYADVPAFHMGMYWWDVWLVGWLAKQIPVVSIHGTRCGSYHVYHHSSNTQREVGLLGTKILDNMELSLSRGGYFGIASKLELYFDGRALKKGGRVLAKW